MITEFTRDPRNGPSKTAWKFASVVGEKITGGTDGRIDRALEGGEQDPQVGDRDHDDQAEEQQRRR